MCERHRLLLATHNEHKTQEIRDLILLEGLPYDVVSLHEMGDDEEIEETGTTIRENSMIKAQTCHQRHHQQHCFEGEVRGVITETPQGEGGFGYDPVFRPEGFDRTFAEMSEEEKNRISHRGRATEALIRFLRSL